MIEVVKIAESGYGNIVSDEFINWRSTVSSNGDGAKGRIYQAC